MTQIQLQYKLHTDTNWSYAGTVNVSLNSAFISPVTVGLAYDIRICSVRANGAVSVWVEVDSETVSSSGTIISTGSLNPNSPANTYNNAKIDSLVEGGAATIRIYGPGGDGSSWSRYAGAVAIVEPAAHITGLTFSTVYYVVYNVPQNTFLPLTAYTASLDDDFYYIGTYTTCADTYTGTGGGGGGGTGGGGTGGDGGSGGGGGRNPIAEPEPELSE